jgi:hypothetical protein
VPTEPAGAWDRRIGYWLWDLACGCELRLGISTLERIPAGQAWCWVHNSYQPATCRGEWPKEVLRA